MFVKPREGLKLLRPDTQTVLLECGEHVPNTGFWIRRLKDGDVMEIAMPTSSIKESFQSKKQKKQEDKTQPEGN